MPTCASVRITSRRWTRLLDIHGPRPTVLTYEDWSSLVWYQTGAAVVAVEPPGYAKLGFDPAIFTGHGQADRRADLAAGLRGDVGALVGTADRYGADRIVLARRGSSVGLIGHPRGRRGRRRWHDRDDRRDRGQWLGRRGARIGRAACPSRSPRTAGSTSRSGSSRPQARTRERPVTAGAARFRLVAGTDAHRAHRRADARLCVQHRGRDRRPASRRDRCGSRPSIRSPSSRSPGFVADPGPPAGWTVATRTATPSCGNDPP